MDDERGLRVPEPPSEREILALTARIVATCLLAGLDLDDANDVAQDIWTWLLSAGKTKLALTVPWLDVVARNFVRRLWRRRATDLRLRQTLNTQPVRVRDLAAGIAWQRSVDEILPRLRRRDRALLILIDRGGLTFPEAAKALGLAAGSWSRARRRIQQATAPLKPAVQACQRASKRRHEK
jgi:DNA-directed RNA polymerase specialized sigma24 family protein